MASHLQREQRWKVLRRNLVAKQHNRECPVGPVQPCQHALWLQAAPITFCSESKGPAAKLRESGPLGLPRPSCNSRTLKCLWVHNQFSWVEDAMFYMSKATANGRRNTTNDRPLPLCLSALNSCRWSTESVCLRLRPTRWRQLLWLTPPTAKKGKKQPGNFNRTDHTNQKCVQSWLRNCLANTLRRS